MQKPLYDPKDLPTFDPPFVFPHMIDPTVQAKKEWVEPTRQCVLCGTDPPPLEPMVSSPCLEAWRTSGADLCDRTCPF